MVKEVDTPEMVQWRNIRKVVKELADLCFGSPDDLKYGSCHIALTTSLTAKDGLHTTLEPLPDRVKANMFNEVRLKEAIAVLIHDQSHRDPFYTPWVEGGSTIKQESALEKADELLTRCRIGHVAITGW